MMRMRLVTMFLIWFGCVHTTAIAAGFGNAAVRGGQKSLGRALRRPTHRTRAFDLNRDGKTPLSVLKRERTVDRYTLATRAASELKRGIPANRHMTSVATRRPLTASSATARLGLSAKPNVVERVTIPRGTRLHFDKVVGGKPGYGEITVPSRLPENSIRKVIKLRP